MLSDAIKKAQNVHRKSKKIQSEKRKNRPVTTNGFIQYFYDLYEKYNYGTPLPLKKETRNKVSGLIRLLKNNGYEDKAIYELLEKVFEKWGSLQGVKTNNRKDYILDTKPNLMDIVNCRDDILRELEVHREPKEEKSLLEMWREG